MFFIKCETVCCHDATASSFVPQVQSKVFAYFHAVAVKLHSSMQNWLFGLPGQIFLWTIPLLFTCLATFQSQWVYTFSIWIIFPFPKHLSNHRKGLHRISSEICTKSDTVLLLDPSWNHSRIDTRLQIKGHKKSACISSSVKICALTPKIC
jgi:hypothetical protein